MSKPHIFISHTRRDAHLVESIREALQRRGLNVFTESDLRPGDRWREAIQSAIRQSDAVIMLVASPENALSSWMSYEVGMAEALGKRVMVLLRNQHSVTELPEEVAANQIVDFDPREPERAARDIASRLVPAG
jgi:nucleoside 2-deoxyribosyltransferase